MEKLKYLLIFLLLLPIAFAGWGEGGWGECGTVVTQSCSGGSSGGGSGGGGSTALIYETGNEPTNGTCEQTEQLLDGRCYSCDKDKGYLEFNTDDRSVVCITCASDYILSDNRTCILTAEKETKNYENLIFFAVVLIGLGILSSPIIKKFKKSKHQEEVEESHGEENL